MTISRRKFLKIGGAAAVVATGAGTLVRPARAAIAAPADPSLAAASDPKRIAFRNLHTGEQLDIEFFKDQAYVPAAMSSIETVLRDFRNGERHPIDPCLMDYLHEVATSFGVYPEFNVISGYRSPATNAMLRAETTGVARHSFHMQGRAIDVRLAGVDCARLAQKALSLRRGGVGYYRVSNFVHLDTGTCRTWRG